MLSVCPARIDLLYARAPGAIKTIGRWIEDIEPAMEASEPCWGTATILSEMGH
jgi:hypothetical protein